jgi:rhodanese-related sulfurtransferase
MNTRTVISVLLVSLGFILAFLPSVDKASLKVKPGKVLQSVLDPNSVFTADQVAKFIVSEDSSVQIIDVRTSGEYEKFSIPGAVNIPYEKIATNPDTLRVLLNRGYARNIFYSNGDLESGYTFVLAVGSGFRNVYIMKGGLNDWFRLVMNTEFKGDRITARENALFETRTRARKLFNDINSLPDSLKTKYLLARQQEAKKLDGGCE